MKNKYVLPLILTLCLFSGCVEEIAEEASAEINMPDSVYSAYSETEITAAADTYQTASEAEMTSAAVTTCQTVSETILTTLKKVTEPPEELSFTDIGPVEVYSSITLEEFITETNAVLTDGSALLDTSEVGEFETEIPCVFEDEEYLVKVKYTVVDTTKPLILNGGWSVYHEIGTPFDLGEYVGFADNYDRNPILTYTGEVDPDTEGSYKLTATVSDSSGNETSWDVTVDVTGNIPDYPDNNTRVSYEDFIAKYDGVRFGIDVSAWQGDIDFNAVKEAGCSFVIMRIGKCYGSFQTDDCFRANIDGASAAGLDVGVYFYSTDNTADGIRTDAGQIAALLDGRELDFPVVFDWEDFGTFQEYGMSIHDLNGLFELFAEEMENYGYSAMLYSSKNFLNNFWYEEVKNDYPVWLAHYTSQTDYTGKYALWQASAYGRIPGIDGDVDMDIQYTD